ncbi:MAG: S8 family serine peptidase, partial [Gammaproteobacteria bacterium]|nr:S8 family serine peptidase [Gammaproteobacteria bacterium]
MKARGHVRSLGVAVARHDGGRHRSAVTRRFVDAFPTKIGGVVLSAIRAPLAFLLIVGAGGAGLAMDRVRAETGVDRAVARLGVSGAGTIVAIMDRGIDWQSNDFRNDDGTTRIAYIFDLSDDSSADDRRNAYGRGTIYTRQQIDRALAAGTMLATRDAVGHGTTTTGIAAGNGRNSPGRKYRGVAPEATIIAVKVVAGEGSGEPDFWDPAALPVAIDFVVDKARELAMPVVMLLNLGSIGGPTDGTSAMARKIDATVGPDHPGVVFVTGTGDDGVPSKTQNRAAGGVPNGGTLDLRFALDRGEGSLEVWYDRNERFAVSIDTPTGMLGPSPATQFEATGAGVRVFHYRGGDDFYDSQNGKRLLHIYFDSAAGPGDYTLRLDHTASSGGSSIHFDASLNTLLGESGRFLNYVTPGSIWDGATAFRNVAPNSYVIRTEWTDIDGVDRTFVGEGEVGELWTGSSVGPTVDGRIGVDVSSPGDRIVTTYAPRSSWASARWNLIKGGDGLYGMAGAVSAAAPVVTGIIALMLETDPTLDAVSVKRILQETARTDEFTGTTPNTLWGYGKVDAFEALMAVRRESSNRGANFT